jgi:hypothetical protein
VNPGDDLFARLELIHEALTATADSVAAGRAPGDETERDRCRRVAELLAGQGRRVVDLLAKPPGGWAVVITRFLDGTVSPVLASDAEARVVAEQDRILAEAGDREQGEEP